VNTTFVHTTFVDRTIIERTTVVNPNHAAFSGGPGGVQHQPTAQEQVAAHETHTPPTTFQTQHETTARSAPASYAKNNGGHPTNLAVAKPLAVESHPAPARTATTEAGAGKSSAGEPHSNGQVNHTYSRQAPNTNTAPRTSTPPKTNTAPKSNPKPAPKPKPEGHEK
jgi:hypothetical protein